ncbi:hypothetical protein EDC04DRAFT_868789 [Pisolithus marmoratus]|nr:hypothetical protein EDC04DRAFT_868789 [Pisolithus marmoratus]
MDITDDISRKREKLRCCPPGRDGRDVALFDLAEALYQRFEKDHEIDDLNEAITFYRDALELRAVENDDRSLTFHQLALCLVNRYGKLGVVDDLEEAIILGRAALDLRPSGHPGRHVSLINVACDLRKRFTKKAAIRDLEEAIEMLRSALELCPGTHPQRSSSLLNLALCLSNRYDRHGVVDDLEEAITLGRAGLELCPPGNPNRAASLSNLACDLGRRFTKKAEIHDLEEAIELFRSALELCPATHPQRSLLLHELALCLSNRYDRHGPGNDLEEAITLGRAALDLRPSGHPNRDVSLCNLASDLRKRFVKKAAIRDLEEAIELHRSALELRPATHPARSLSLNNLALCLSNRYDRHGLVNDLEEAITLGRAALDHRPPGYPYRDISLYNLACDLRRRFAKKAAIRDLEEAIELYRSALGLRPATHPQRSLHLHELALCLSNRYDRHGLVDDLEEAITLGRAALDLRPPGHPDRDASLFNLACTIWKKFEKQADISQSHSADSPNQAASVVCPTSKADLASSLFKHSLHLWARFQTQATMADLNEAIRLIIYALELRLPRDSPNDGAWVQKLAQDTGSNEPGLAVENLADLVNCFVRHISCNQHAIADLDVAIILCRYVLQFRSTGHPNRPSSLHHLAQCLVDRFRQQTAIVDLDDAIALEQEALQLLMHGESDYDMSRRCLTACLQMKFDSQVSTMSSGAPGVKQVICNVAFETLKNMPTRLLHIPTGNLCNRDAQATHFMNSPQYKQLVSLCTTYCGDQQMALIRTEVSRYFRYVMLSHRWGEGEPLLRDIEGHQIYNMPTRGGLGKLQAFCRVALEQDYLWAWSDTCCIDKHSSAELQEAIGSMFAWYRQSALTIAYLSDVPDTGSLESSEWFRRGWTLQELLAPQTVLFYTQTWSLYKNIASSNHKIDVAILDELERATGIGTRFLTNFSPGMDDARSRLQWASSRRTTRPEDIAYSLFGIFNLHLPVIYGESAEHSLGRLLAEVISQSGDVSVLDWVGEASLFHSCFPARITSYQMIPLPQDQPNIQAQSSATSQASQGSLFEILCYTCGSLATSLLKYLGRYLPPSIISEIQRPTPDSYGPGDVYDFHSFTRAPFPRFINRCLILPCISHRVTDAQLTGEDPSAPSYAYKIQASGLRPLVITLPQKMENMTTSQDALQLVRPWNSKGQSAIIDAANEEQLLSALGKPFHALLLTELPHSEYKRIASSTLITVQPIDSASILQSKVRIFNIV